MIASPPQIPGYTQGFARHRGRSAAPGPGHRPAGLWAPFLGPTGSTLFDHSGHGRHGTLANMDPAADWIVGHRGWSLDFDGTDDHVPFSDVPATGDCTFFCVFRNRSVSSLQVLAYFVNSGHEDADYLVVGLHDSRVVASADNDAASSRRSGVLGNNRWYSLVVTKAAGAITGIYTDGRPDTHAATIHLAGSVAKSLLGGSWYLGSFQVPFDGDVAAAFLFHRQWTADECARMHADPFALLRPRRPPAGMVPAVGGPYRTVVRQVFHAGRAAGQTFSTGQTAGQIDGGSD